MQKILLLTAALCLSSAPRILIAETSPREYAVEISASVAADPPAIQLKWPASALSLSYEVSRREPQGWMVIGRLEGTASGFVDRSVEKHRAYEYQVRRTTSRGFEAFGYLQAGMELPAIDQRGSVILVIEESVAGPLEAEIAQLSLDLVGDGWRVIPLLASSNASPASVKEKIKGHYQADPSGVRAVFLLGHMPVAYSGNLRPDGHEDHEGAWPADVFYGEMDGVWTDETVANTSAQSSRNHNLPGDGKFDQSSIPSDVEMAVGRVDLSRMDCFPGQSEVDLLRQYLVKNHRFRHRRIAPAPRGLVADNFGETGGEAFAASGWRNFSGFFGEANNRAVGPGEFFPTLGQESYLWSYGCGGGAYDFCNGIGGSGDFGKTDIQSVFTLFLGSYFGDWDAPNDFLRAPLGGKSWTLVSGWAGRPHWFLHPMALGGTIGESVRLTQNNNGRYQPSTSQYARGIQIALMGDPTLRMQMVAPVENVSVTGALINWSPSPDSAVKGYYLLRASSGTQIFRRISGEQPITGTQWQDPNPEEGAVYQVRAVSLETSASGSFYNLSQGTFSDGSLRFPASDPIMDVSQIPIDQHFESNSEGLVPSNLAPGSLQPVTEQSAIESTRSSASPVDVVPPAVTNGRSTATRRTASRDSQPPSPGQETETSGSEILIEGNQNPGGTSSPNQNVEREAEEGSVISAPTFPGVSVTSPRKKSVVKNSNVFSPPPVIAPEKITSGNIRPAHWRIENGRPVFYPADKE